MREAYGRGLYKGRQKYALEVVRQMQGACAAMESLSHRDNLYGY